MRAHQRPRRERVHHTDDWLITYADTITLLLCLFVIILTIRTGDRTATHAAATPMTTVPPPEDIFASHPPPSFPFGIGEAARDDPPPERAAAAIEHDAEPPVRARIAPEASPRQVAKVAERAAEPPPPTNLQPGGVTTPAPANGSIVPDPVASAAPPATLPAMVERLRSQGAVVAAETDDRITTLRISSGTFFGSGSAALSGAGKSVLRDVAATLKSSEFNSFQISIEGHTDDSPISTPQFQSNWELSTARAAAVVRCLLEQGIARERLTAAGYADTFPIAPNRTADGTVIPENQARNRRVVIRLKRLETAQRQTPAHAP